MRYASIFATILIVWIMVVIIAGLANETQITYDLYRLTTVFTLVLFVFGFSRRK